MKNSEELKRLTFGASENETTGLIKIEIVANCSGNSSDILERTKEVLKRIVDCELPFSHPIDDWKEVLPKWFVEACSPELSEKRVEELLRTDKGFETLSNIWTVSGFIYWFRPEQRSWYWWDGVVKDSNTLIVQVLVDGFPFTWGALEFLLRAAGADDVEEV